MRVSRQAAKKNASPHRLVVGNKSYPLDKIQVDIVADNSPLQRRFPSNVKITPVTSEEPKTNRQNRLILPKVPSNTLISRTKIPSKGPATRSSPVQKPSLPATRKSAVPTNHAWTLRTKPVNSSIVTRTSSKMAPGVSSVKRVSPLSRSLPVKRSASPDDVLFEKEVKVSKSVKITPITQPQTRPLLNSASKLSIKPKDVIRSNKTLTQNRPVNVKSSAVEVKTQTAKASLTPRTPATPPGPPGPSGTPRPSGPPQAAPIARGRGPPGPPVAPAAPSQAETHICDECGWSFKSRRSLAEHQETVHVIKCDDCQERFDSQTELSQHSLTHLEKCFYCEEMFKTSGEIETHLEAEHEKKCRAEGCEHKFYTAEALSDHTKEHHHFPCSKCSSILESLEGLAEHTQLLHTFICDYNHCTYVADEQEKLESHEKLVHQRCEECEDEFTWTDPAEHKCFYTSNNVSPFTDRVQLQNLYFKHLTYYFI